MDFKQGFHAVYFMPAVYDFGNRGACGIFYAKQKSEHSHIKDIRFVRRFFGRNSLLYEKDNRTAFQCQAIIDNFLRFSDWKHITHFSQPDMLSPKRDACKYLPYPMRLFHK